MAKKIEIPTVERISIVPPKTIVYWSDKTKTEAIADKDPFNEEMGVLICICKKFFGSYSDVEKAIQMGKEDVREKFKQMTKNKIK